MDDDHCYDKDGHPITFRRMIVLKNTPGYKRVGRTELLNGLVVSTVWLGNDLAIGMGPMELFETIVFDKEIDDAVSQERYATIKEAELGHKRTVEAFS